MSSPSIYTSTSRSSPVPAPTPHSPTSKNTHFWVPKDSLVTKSNSTFMYLNYLPFSLFGAFNFLIYSLLLETLLFHCGAYFPSVLQVMFLRLFLWSSNFLWALIITFFIQGCSYKDCHNVALAFILIFNISSLSTISSLLSSLLPSFSHPHLLFLLPSCYFPFQVTCKQLQFSDYVISLLCKTLSQ